MDSSDLGKDKAESKYRSRKFMVTVGSIVLAAGLELSVGLSPSMANVLLAAMASYNLANAWTSK